MGQRVVSSFRTTHNNYYNDFMSQQPLSTPLQDGLRFLQHPLPAPLSARGQSADMPLRLAFPEGEIRAYHVPYEYHG
jgi:hypothetical protein